jgi:autotransporter translocation and assembly factor TamB
VGRVVARVIFTIIAVVLFVLAAVGGTTGSASELDIIAWGLAVYALGRIVP